jgi:hypothetical protein
MITGIPALQGRAPGVKNAVLFRAYDFNDPPPIALRARGQPGSPRRSDCSNGQYEEVLEDRTGQIRPAERYCPFERTSQLTVRASRKRSSAGGPTGERLHGYYPVVPGLGADVGAVAEFTSRQPDPFSGGLTSPGATHHDGRQGARNPGSGPDVRERHPPWRAPVIVPAHAVRPVESAPGELPTRLQADQVDLAWGPTEPLPRGWWQRPGLM